MDTSKMREEFETSPKFRGMDFSRSSTHPDYYESPYANGAWDGWQASREAVVVELPSEDTCRTSTSKEEAVQEAYNHALGECRAAIEAQGLKVAP
ncbi:hypothetical protein HX137_12520 [Pseudomonas sp. 165]|uniref:hypothetical protein n=1 Tax=Pseudomonas sp. 165 TaxID=2746722 RepID=UPI002578088E|nr:hypothetical protein [Pseudomonas sp. 165]MDM1711458.1 hypothetical protein [Pseudomonas sp. 165]